MSTVKVARKGQSLGTENLGWLTGTAGLAADQAGEPGTPGLASAVAPAPALPEPAAVASPTARAEVLSGRTAKRQAPRPSTQAGCHAGEGRVAFIADLEQWDKVLAYAYWQRLQIKEVMGQALTEFFATRPGRSLPPERRRK